MEEIRGSKVFVVHFRAILPFYEFFDEAVDLLLCASVNSASRFIREKASFGFERTCETFC